LARELSGTVRRVLVDVNDQVKKGQVLVELDTAKLDAQVGRSRANLAAAQARFGASARPRCAKRAPAWQRLEEVQRISGGQLPSAAEMDTAAPPWSAPRPTWSRPAPRWPMPRPRW
jgi:HlyD family secretion protein